MLKHVKSVIALSIVTVGMNAWAADAPATTEPAAVDQSQQTKTASPQAADPVSKQATKDTDAKANTNANTSEKKEKDPLTVGYRRVMRNGQEYFCKRGVATGSRLRTEEICSTREQLEEAAENLRDQIRNSQTSTDDNRK